MVRNRGMCHCEACPTVCRNCRLSLATPSGTKRPVRNLLAAISVFLGITTSSADIVWDSLSQPAGIDAPFSVTQFRAAGFRVTGSDSLFLNSVTFNYDGDVTGVANIRLFSDAASKPSTPLGRISDIPLDAGASGNFTVPSDTDFTLSPNTTYWVVTRMRPSTGSGFINTRTSATETPIGGTSGLTFVGSLFSVNSGSTWQDWGVTPAMNINVTVVPEPTTVTLLGCGAIGLVVVGRRKGLI